MLKRDELTNPDSCMRRALPDERTFVLLARDRTAPWVIRFWCLLRWVFRKNKWSDPQIVEALDCAQRMDDERYIVKLMVRSLASEAPEDRVTCPRCNGSGEVTTYTVLDRDDFHQVLCPACCGTKFEASEAPEYQEGK